MPDARIDPALRKPLRLWPGVVAAVLLVFLRLVLPVAIPEATIVGLMGAALAVVAIVVWWLFFSRAPWFERAGAIILIIVALLATARLVHESIAGGAMGFLLYVLAVPVVSLALVAWAAAGRRLAGWPRRASMVATILLACGVFTVVRTGGVTSDVIGSDFHWRWTPTPEQRLLAQADSRLPLVPIVTEAPDTEPPAAARPKPAVPAPAPRAAADWPGFRGPERNGVIAGILINPDWSAAPPAELWRRPVGPGWSSFAVDGDLFYTQEQRGDDEIVACYRVSTGEPVWMHRDAVRFWESNGGAGPRATPTLHGGRVYAFGATGLLNALDAGSGAVVWSRNVASDTDRQVPIWGFASSPLVVDDVVIVAAAGTLAAYDLAAGRPRWTGPSYGGSYSSPHRVTIDGVVHVLLLGGPGAISVDPASGAVLWEHEWSPGAIVQPALTADGDILVNAITATGGVGTRRLAIARDALDSARDTPGGWRVNERWTSIGLKPYFSDFVVHEGHAYGFDGSILACIDLQDGARKWKGGRYGNGQMVLLPDQDLLLVLSEDGELALVGATPDRFTERARFRALDAKTWNHPVLVGDVLLVRNGEEMAAFRLALTGR